MKLLLLGATGLVGSAALKLASAGDPFTKVIAPTRTPLAGTLRDEKGEKKVLRDLISKDFLDFRGLRETS